MHEQSCAGGRQLSSCLPSFSNRMSSKPHSGKKKKKTALHSAPTPCSRPLRNNDNNDNNDNFDSKQQKSEDEMVLSIIFRFFSHFCIAFEVCQGLIILAVLEGPDRLHHSGGRAGAVFVRAVAHNYPSYLEGGVPFPFIPRREEGGGGEKKEEESKNKNNAGNDTEGNTGGGGGDVCVGTSNDDDDDDGDKVLQGVDRVLLKKKNEKKFSAILSKSASAIKARARAARCVRQAGNQVRAAKKQARAATRQARAAKKQARADEKSAAKAAEKAQRNHEQVDAAEAERESKRKNGRPGLIFNLTATAAAGAGRRRAAAAAAAADVGPQLCFWPLACACPGCRAAKAAEVEEAEEALAAATAPAGAAAAEAAPANNNDKYNNIVSAAPFLRDLVKPKHLRYDWEEVHPAQALSSGSGLVVDAPRGGRLRPSPAALRLGALLESEAFYSARSVVFWVSLGVATSAAAIKAFAVFEALSVAF